MLFRVLGIVELKYTTSEIEEAETLNMDFLIEAETNEYVRKILDEYAIIILSINEYKDEIAKFGKINVEFAYKKSNIHIISNMEDINDFCDLLYKIGIEIIKINYIENPLSEEKIQDIIDYSKEKIENERTTSKALYLQKEAAGKTSLINKDLDKIKEIIERSITNTDEIIEKSITIVDGMKIKKLKDLKGELSKLRMGTNQIKIITTTEEFLNLTAKIQNEFIERMGNEIENIELIDKTSIINNLDIMKEYSNYLTAIKIAKIGGAIKREYMNYVSLGFGMIYIKLLFRDIVNKFKNISNVIYKLFDWIEILIILLIINMIMILVFKSTGESTNANSYFDLVNIGTMGISIYLIKIFRTQKIIRLIILLGLGIGLYFMLIEFFRNNLAL